MLKFVLVIGDGERCLQAGMDHYITSEYKVNVLLYYCSL